MTLIAVLEQKINTFSFSSPRPGHKPDRFGELGDGDPLSERLVAGQASGEGGHAASPSLPEPLAAAQDRHGREDEKDGRAAAVCHQGAEEQEGGGESGQCDNNQNKVTGSIPAVCRK